MWQKVEHCRRYIHDNPRDHSFLGFARANQFVLLFRTGLSVHMNQVHKESLSHVENALPNRQGLDVEIFGMEGLPEEVRKQHEERIVKNFFDAQRERFEATGNPPPGEGRPARKLKFETPEELKKRFAEFRAKKAAAKAAGVPLTTIAPPGGAAQSPGQTASPGTFVSPLLRKSGLKLRLVMLTCATCRTPRSILPCRLTVQIHIHHFLQMALLRLHQPATTNTHLPTFPHGLLPYPPRRTFLNDRVILRTTILDNQAIPMAQPRKPALQAVTISTNLSVWRKQASNQGRHLQMGHNLQRLVLLVQAVVERRSRRRRRDGWCMQTQSSVQRRRWRCCLGTSGYLRPLSSSRW